MAETVRLLRILEYVGPYDWLVETFANNGVKGQHIGPNFIIRETVLGPFPETVPLHIVNGDVRKEWFDAAVKDEEEAWNSRNRKDEEEAERIQRICED